MKGKTFYLCDRRKCPNCHQECKHTESIFNAKNFSYKNGDFWENENADDIRKKHIGTLYF